MILKIERFGGCSPDLFGIKKSCCLYDNSSVRFYLFQPTTRASSVQLADFISSTSAATSDPFATSRIL